MSDYLKTERVLDYLKIEMFELFNLCKEGKLKAYNEYSTRVVDLDSCKKGKRVPLDENRYLDRLLMFAESFNFNVGTLIHPNENTHIKEQEELRKYDNAQLEDVPIIPEDCLGFDFTLPPCSSSYKTPLAFQNLIKAFETAKTFNFKKSDVEKLKTEERPRFEKECGSDKPVPKSKQLVDEFVRSLTIYSENDREINIQIPGKKAEPFPAHTLDFHRLGKEWRLLKEIIQEGRYCIGSTKNKEGDANRKLLKTVGEKLIKWLNKEFDAQIPSKYKLFEKSAKHEEGTWKPKFKIQPAGKYSSLTDMQILKKIEVEYKVDANQVIINELVVAAKEKGISNDDLANIIPSKHKNEEEYDYKEGGHVTNKP